MAVLLKPVISEKANQVIDTKNSYTFLVDPRATKLDIKHAVKQVYGVDVVKVRTLISPPTVKTKYTKAGLQVGKSNKVKKAIVDIKEGQTIEIYGNI